MRFSLPLGFDEVQPAIRVLMRFSLPLGFDEVQPAIRV